MLTGNHSDFMSEESTTECIHQKKQCNISAHFFLWQVQLEELQTPFNSLFSPKFNSIHNTKGQLAEKSYALEILYLETNNSLIIYSTYESNLLQF